MANIYSNIVGKDTLRRVQLETLELLKNALANTFGPYGSNTCSFKENGLSRYTKDGHTVLSNIQLAGEIERSVLSDIEESTRTQAVQVGDSTTSITILSYLIFKRLCEFEQSNQIQPVTIVRYFKEITEKICERIDSYKKEITLDDIYNISLISTNGNEQLANLMATIYKDYGFEVFVDVKASMNHDTYVKEINGLALECGFLDPTLINSTAEGTCTVNNPRIYAFQDPIDTNEMGMLFDAILENNIVKPLRENEPGKIINTVILCPKLSRDYSEHIDRLMTALANADGSQKGFLNIITNITSTDVDQYDDICDLCGCKYIKKYIDPEIQRQDIEAGVAPTPLTVANFYGEAARVVSDHAKTTFITPKNMYKEDGVTPTDLFAQRIDYISKQIDKLTVEGNNTTDIYQLKKRLNSLKGKMVEIYIGGVTVADRDAERDLLEDAALNCRNASQNGVGYGANFEGYRAAREIANEYKSDENSDLHKVTISDFIRSAYCELMTMLYNNSNIDKADRIVDECIEKGCPYNIVTKEYDGKVLTSIKTDICSLQTISKIVTIMATANQFLLPTINMNKY